VATWEELRQYVLMTQRVDGESADDWVTFVVSSAEDRLQQVFVSKLTLNDGAEEWALIESPFGEIDKVDLPKALKESSTMVCGGVGLFQGNLLTLRHALPLENMQVNEFERPLMLVAIGADQLEERLLGGDRF
jgi:hypothetical protein